MLIALTFILAQDPAADEQAFIYELNRARNNPQRYASENGLGSLLDGIAATPPLAVNMNLLASSGFKAVEMATNDYFAHQSAVTGDWPNKIERDNGYLLNTGLIDGANNVESLAAGTTVTALQALRMLLEDAGVSPPGHRYHLLATGPGASFWLQHVEIGVGHAFNGSSTYDNYYAIHTGYRNSNPAWITGVVYNDANANGRYDQGEGIAGVTVTATGPSTLNVTSNAAGGWSIQAGAGSWTVTATGGTFVGTSTGNVTVASDNVEVDFESGTAAAEVGFANQPGGTGTGGGGGGGGSSSGDGDKKRCGLLGLEIVAALALVAVATRFLR